MKRSLITALTVLNAFFMLYSQNEISFDKMHADSIPIKSGEKKANLDISYYPDSPNHFLAIYSCESGDSAKYTYFTYLQNIIITSLDSLENTGDIIKDGVCMVKNGDNIIYSTYVKGVKEGQAVEYDDGKLWGEFIYKNNEIISTELYYPGGEIWATIYRVDTDKKGVAAGNTANIRVDVITEYYETGSIKREEIIMVDGDVLKEKHYTENGEKTKFPLPFFRKAFFPGGVGKLFSYIVNNTGKTRPLVRIQEDEEGVVKVKFCVEEDGSISNVKIEKSLRPDLDKEALNVIKKMPKWSPTVVYGEIKRSYYVIPIRYNK